MTLPPSIFFFFFLNDPPPPEISPLPLHAALPIPIGHGLAVTPIQMADAYATIANRGILVSPHLIDHVAGSPPVRTKRRRILSSHVDRKSTRLNSSHLVISYAVFCLKKKNMTVQII